MPHLQQPQKSQSPSGLMMYSRVPQYWQSDEADRISRQSDSSGELDQPATPATTNPLFLHPIQAKLLLRPTSDPYEQEADQVAQHLLETFSTPQKALHSSDSSDPVQPSITPLHQPVTASPKQKPSTQTSLGQGHTLPSQLREPLGTVFDFNFDHVQIYTHHHAHQLNKTLRSRAFTQGQGIYFRQGEYQPHTPSGQALLFHELTHVVQQDRGSSAPTAVQAYALTDLKEDEISDIDLLSALAEAQYNWQQLIQTYGAHPIILNQLMSWRELKLQRLLTYLEQKHQNVVLKLNPDTWTTPNKISVKIVAGQGHAALQDFRKLAKTIFGQQDIETAFGIDLSVQRVSQTAALDILAAYHFNWFEMRDDLAYQQAEESALDYQTKLDLMAQMLEFRQQVVGSSGEHAAGLLHTTIQHIESQYATLDPPVRVSALAFGSTAPTSDYDVTFEIPDHPELESEAVAYFNWAFRQRFGVPSGVMFDTNVYTSGFMPSGQKQYKDKFKYHTDTDKEFLQDAKNTKHRLQLALSFVALRQYFGSSPTGVKDWSDFKQNTEDELVRFLALSQRRRSSSSQLTPSLQLPINQADLTETALTDVRKIFEYTEELYEDTERAILAEKQLQSFDPSVQQQLDSDEATRQAEQTHLEAQAKDQLYVDTLQEIGTILAQLKVSQDKLDVIDPETDDEASTELTPERRSLLQEQSDLIIAFQKAQGKALIYANEAYFSAGSAVHVVLGMQAGSSVKIGRQHRIQSLLMNVGYKLQHFRQAHQHHGLGRALIGTAKYGQRVGDLALASNPKSTGADKALMETLSETTQILLQHEDELVQHYKKDHQRFPTPSSKEEGAIANFSAIQPDQVTTAYLEIAQKVLGPYYWDKHIKSSKGLWTSARRGSGGSLPPAFQSQVSLEPPSWTVTQPLLGLNLGRRGSIDLRRGSVDITAQLSRMASRRNSVVDVRRRSMDIATPFYLGDRRGSDLSLGSSSSETPNLTFPQWPPQASSDLDSPQPHSLQSMDASPLEHPPQFLPQVSITVQTEDNAEDI